MNYGFLKISAAVPEIKVANCKFNANEIIKLIKQADSLNSKMIVFPELAITAYTCGDLFHQDILIGKAVTSLQRILKETSDINIVSILGVPIRYENNLYNCAVVIQRGLILGIIPKTHIPCYKEFYEDRWFSEGGNLQNRLINICKQTVPFGTDILFELAQFEGACFGVEICEDLWVPIPPSSYQAIAGAVILFNLSASNEIIGKIDYRMQLVSQQSARCIAGYIYTSTGIYESTTDLVFGGHMIISENGAILKQSERFDMGSKLICTEIDVKRLINERNKNTTFTSAKIDKIFRKIHVRLGNMDMKNIDRQVDPFPFVPVNPATRNKRCSEIFEIQATGLAKRFIHTKIKHAVIGISGGLDSTLALLVTARAFDKIGIPKENIIAVTMPGFGTTGVTYNNAIELMHEIGATIKEIDIKEACKVHFRDIEHDSSIHDTTYENVQARERTKILMNISNKMNGLVVGTGDLSELALGWCTYNGDHMSMYSVNCSIPKTLVKSLVEWIADNAVQENIRTILLKIVNTPISPELLPPDKKGNIKQKTEDIIGPYELHDFYLYHFLRYGATPKKILFLAEIAFKDRYSVEQIKKWLKVFYRRFFSQQFKRSCVPDGPKVGTISLSPRGDWRMPSDASVEMWIKELD